MTTRTSYTPDGNVASITAVNPTTGNQVTSYTYGTTLADSDIATSTLKRYETYPDSVGGSDRVAFTYNRQRQVTSLTDQNGTVHSFDFDKLGRATQDRVTTLGTNVDGAVRRLATTYEVRGMRLRLTSYDNATVGSGSIVNEVQFAYNDFGQLIADYQSHSGAVNTGSTPKVQYGYADGSANTIRPTSLTYPNGRVLSYDYSTAGSIPDALGRIASLIDDDGTTHLMMGAHPIKLGLSRFVIDLIERDLITHFATNGAGLIHDFELALVGGTSEDVSKWIQVGQFGLWQETAGLNDVIREAANRNEGLGEAVGRVIEDQQFPHRDLSLAAACWRKSIPCTCHVSIGSDIIHSLPNCDGAALGQTSYTDFLIFTHTIEQLEGGVYLNVGSAVTGPEVYLKALSMGRNVAHQEDREIRHFTTAVFDLVPLPENYRDGAPSKSHPGYYYRPWKTILVRTVADGGQSYYFCADHRQTIPTLWQGLTRQSDRA